MIRTEADARLIAEAKDSLIEIGYSQSLLYENYGFTEGSGEVFSLGHIDLAAFGRYPTSYRNACLGLALPEDDREEIIQRYRVLGAPQILAAPAGSDHVSRWQIRARGEARRLETFPRRELGARIRENKAGWNPNTVMSARSIGLTAPAYQLDFFDYGLLPALEDEVQGKLGALLERIVIQSKNAYRDLHNDGIDEPRLFRLIFRFIAAKLLYDREGDPRFNADADSVVAAVNDYYFQSRPSEPLLESEGIRRLAWQMIKESIHLQNISVEALAYVYENTMINPEQRKRHGIHATPHAIAELVVRELPFESLAEDERTVFEPFCGHAPFLVAALGRLRDLLRNEITPLQRHDYFRRMLSGAEREALSREIALYSLILADYPNPNGWRIEGVDLFSLNAQERLSSANIVLCNPPFERFPTGYKDDYPLVQSFRKPVEALMRTLRYPPRMLGFVLPQSFRQSRAYSAARRELESRYSNIHYIDLPDNVFRFGKVETVLVLAHNEGNGVTRRLTRVAKPDYRRFVLTREATNTQVYEAKLLDERISEHWQNPLASVWKELEDLPVLGDVADVHRGIEYNVSQDHPSVQPSLTPLPNYVRGVYRVDGSIEPYLLTSSVYLNVDPDKRRRNAFDLPWGELKVIANAARSSIGVWRIIAAVDEEGLIGSQNFHGIWPNGELSVEVIAAILNGPIANVFLSTLATWKGNQVNQVEAIPLPVFSEATKKKIVELVRSYRAIKLEERQRSENIEEAFLTPQSSETGLQDELLLEIDSEVIRAYGISQSARLQLLAYLDENLGLSRTRSRIDNPKWRALFEEPDPAPSLEELEYNRVLIRYHALVDKKHSEVGFSDSEAQEMEELGRRLDEMDRPFYQPALEHLRQLVTRLQSGKA